MSDEQGEASSLDAFTRSEQVRKYVEQMVTSIGEHPEVELKAEWRWATAKDKAECILDMQATANSEISVGSYRLIVIGVREDTREFVGCDHAAFDDAKLRAIFEEYLDPAPEFEVLRLLSSKGRPFVVLRIPRQALRPIVTRKELGDDKRTFIRPGEVWIKPGAAETAGSRKRRVQSRRELVSMFELDHHIESGCVQGLKRLFLRCAARSLRSLILR